MRLKISTHKIIFIFIILLTAFLRFFDLSETPQGATAKEALYANLLSLNIENIRFLFSFLNVIFVITSYFFIKTILLKLNFKKNIELFSLVGMLLISSSFWHIKFSRIATFDSLLYSLLIIIAYTIITIILYILYLKLSENINNTSKYKKLYNLDFIKRKILLFIFLILISSTFWQANEYFFNWKFSKDTNNQFNNKYKQIAETLNNIPPEIEKFVIINTNGEIIDNLPIEYQIMKLFSQKNNNIKYLTENNIKDIPAKKDTFIVPINQSIDIFKKINKDQPNGSVKVKDGVIFYVLYD